MGYHKNGWFIMGNHIKMIKWMISGYPISGNLYIYIPSASKPSFFWSLPNHQVFAGETRFYWNGKIASSNGFLNLVDMSASNQKETTPSPSHSYFFVSRFLHDQLCVLPIPCNMPWGDVAKSVGTPFAHSLFGLFLQLYPRRPHLVGSLLLVG